MAFDFGSVFTVALNAGLTAAKPGGKAAEGWFNKSAKANEEALKAIAEEFARGGISKETAQYLLGQNERALKAEAAALKVILQASAQAAINGFFESLRSGLLAALKAAL
jgi:hypothetical protein